VMSWILLYGELDPKEWQVGIVATSKLTAWLVVCRPCKWNL